MGNLFTTTSGHADADKVPRLDLLFSRSKILPNFESSSLLGRKLKNLSPTAKELASSRVSGRVAPKVSGRKATERAPAADIRNIAK